MEYLLKDVTRLETRSEHNMTILFYLLLLSNQFQFLYHDKLEIISKKNVKLQASLSHESSKLHLFFCLGNFNIPFFLLIGPL